jgi:hypothetical protein
MKKALMGISGLVVLTFIIILTVSAKNKDQQSKTTNTEISQDIACCTSVDKCCGLSDSKATSCDPANCSGMKCDPATCKGEKCDPATCKGGKCDPTTCKPNCGGVATAMKCGPINCNR